MIIDPKAQKRVSYCCIFQTQQNKFVNWQGDAEMRGEDFTATVTLGNPDVLVGSGRFLFVPDSTSFLNTFLKFCHFFGTVCKPLVRPLGVVVAHYLQSITPALALGGELVYHRRPGEEGSVMSLVGRYTGQHITRPDVGRSVHIHVAQNRLLWFYR